MSQPKLHRSLILIEKCWICGSSTPMGVEYTKTQLSNNINLLWRYNRIKFDIHR